MTPEKHLHAARVKTRKTVRRSISIPLDLDRKVQALAKRQKTSSNRAFEAFLEAGIAAKESEKDRFFAVAERLRASKDPAEVEQAKRELSQMVFGE